MTLGHLDSANFSHNIVLMILALIMSIMIAGQLLVNQLTSSHLTKWSTETQAKNGFIFGLFGLSDLAENWQFGLQDAATVIQEEIVYLHNHIMQFAALILGFVIVLLIGSLKKSNGYISHRYFVHGTTLEIVWTIAPALVLIAIAIPSFKLLYLQDEIIDASITIKAIGRQWYWSYEYSDYVNSDAESITFDSYMVPTADLEAGQNRLLEVDNSLKLPIDVNTRVITTASDVIHSFAVPALGVKVDAVPGRLNATSLQIDRPGRFYGQCSEICGFGHGFMPIVIDGVSLTNYSNWVLSQA